MFVNVDMYLIGTKHPLLAKLWERSLNQGVAAGSLRFIPHNQNHPGPYPFTETFTAETFSHMSAHTMLITSRYVSLHFTLYQRF